MVEIEIAPFIVKTKRGFAPTVPIVKYAMPPYISSKPDPNRKKHREEYNKSPLPHKSLKRGNSNFLVMIGTLIWEEVRRNILFNS